jgi:tetratricopeptide (TPR) repeat protein
MEAFERAVALDSQFAAAHARLAVSYLTERDFGRDGGLREKSRASLARAMALDSTLLESHLARAAYLTVTDDPEGAYDALQAAARMAPGDAEIVRDLATVQEMLGRSEDAVASHQRAELLEPRWADAAGGLAGAYDRLYRYEEAMLAREREVALSPPHAFAHVFKAATHLLWRADTAAARRVLEQGDQRMVIDLLTRLPSHFAGRAIWLRVVPPAVLAAKDTLTLPGYLRDDWGTPDLFHLMKARHFALTGRAGRARAHADSVIALLEPALQRGPGTGALLDLFTQRSTIAEAYAYTGRTTDAARMIDGYVDDRRRSRMSKWALRLPYALVTAAYVDLLIGRRDLAVARLEEALRLPAGQFISRALLRADASWAPLRGHAGFKRLTAGSD